MSTVTLTNVGPIQSFSLDVPAGGGLVEFLGPHGVGKSQALAAIDATVRGDTKAKPVIGDGAAGAVACAFGAVMTVGRKGSADTAALSIVPIEGRFNIGDLIDPREQGPAAADARRIKAILQITGQRPDLEPFYALVGGKEQFERLVKSGTLAQTSDLVQFAESAKRDLEAKAREAEDEAIKAEERHRVANANCEGVDLTAESDEGKLQQSYEQAIRAESAIADRVKRAKTAKLQAQLAQDQLEQASEGYQGPTVAQAQAKEQATQGEDIAALTVLHEAERALAAARARTEATGVAHATTIRERMAAVSHEKALAGYRAALEAAVPIPPSVDEQGAATRRVAESRAAQSKGLAVRQALQHKQAGADAIKSASAARQLQHRLRDAAGGVEKVLSEAVSKVGGPLFVEGGRLKIQSDRKAGSEPYAELSDGERCLVAVHIAVRAAAEQAKAAGLEYGAVTLAQRFNQELTHYDRAAIHEKAREYGAYVFTARITEEEGGLRAEVFGEG